MKVIYFLVCILALASSIAFAYDPSPLQDFCVAIQDPKDGVFVNGKFCKDPALVKAEDFFKHIEPANTSNPLGSQVTPVAVDQLFGLNTLGISLARIDFAPKGLNPPHTHPRGSEILIVLEGTLYVGFVTSNQDKNRLFTKVLNKGDVFVFPIGLIHFQLNVGYGNAVAIAGLSSQNPGTITIANALFKSNPAISDEVLTKAFQDVAEKILETPLVNSVREDKVVWEEERNECYSVKSGYKLAMRYIIGCLPTRSRLLERRVECTLNCHVCVEESEDELHIFFRCAVARDSWSADGLSSVLHNATYQQTNAMDRIFAICSNESSNTVGRVAMLLWCIWHNRNDKLWNDNVQMSRQIGRHAFDAWNDWYSVHKLQSNNVSGTTEADLVRWEKPALDCGHFMAGMTQWQQTVISSVEGEAWALLLAMEEARYRGLDQVQFESDSKVLIEAIHMKRRGNSEFLSIVHDILSFMSSFINFESTSLKDSSLWGRPQVHISEKVHISERLFALGLTRHEQKPLVEAKGYGCRPTSCFSQTAPMFRFSLKTTSPRDDPLWG
ncbi:hypothetical protein TSUD_165800 [Trifolium subterraneum]|uniref:Cupin type-1 domain-containing protein n=1 Tax=Trifolium subterraneum TaxID=3900 RepID=A0A2Z6NBD3_TRISU|nr:hypothetical protein TSUD_165800 [Trifolium subterraneum]